MLGSLINNRYLLQKELGQGGMGMIYAALDQVLERQVAVKILNHASPGSEARKRLLREAQAAASMNHPNIVSIFDAGEDVFPGATGGVTTPFIVMELIDGQSLYERLPQLIGQAGPCLEIIYQICSALEHAHSHGIIHRDLKPENVIITSAGQVKLTDFGLARSPSSRLTKEGAIAGTVFYMAPEIALGKPADGRADLYSLGVLFYEMATGQLPFTGDEPLTVISQHLYAPVVPPRARRPDLPAALDALIMQLMSKLPEDRPASATELLRVLEVLGKLPASSPASLSQEQGLSLLDRLVRGRLVGRERELSEMSAYWSRAAAGEGYSLLVSGEPGIGKTRLVNELVVHASITGGRVLKGDCYAEGSAPYGPFAQMLLENLPATSGELKLPDFVLADLVAIAPELSASFPGVYRSSAVDPQVEQQRVFESVTAWFSALARQAPMLLFIEDVHWADSGTLALLRHLARRAPRLRLLIVVTYREIELADSGPLQTLLYDLNRERLAARIKLSRLDREQTRQMLETMLNPTGKIDDSLVDAIFRETEGNPFFIEEVTKALIEDGKLCYEDICWVSSGDTEINIPQSVRVTIQTRLAHLPEQTQSVLRMAAIFGREFEFDELLKACDLDEDDLIDALELAERAQIISEVPARSRSSSTRFSFAHFLIPTTLRDSISTLRRQKMHRKAAEAIEEIYPNDGHFYEALAYHYEQAGSAECAEYYYKQAGDRALAVYANQEAEHYYRAALDVNENEPERAELLYTLGEAIFRQGRYQDSVDTWRELIDLNRKLGNPDPIARVYSRAARAAWFTGNPKRGLELCQDGMKTILEITGLPDLSNIPEQYETPGIALLLHETARSYRFNGMDEQALPLCRQAMALAEKLNLVEVQAEIYATLGILPNISAEEAYQALTRAIQLAEPNGLLFTAVRAHINLGDYYLSRGEMNAAMEHFWRAREQAHKAGMIRQEYDLFSEYLELSLVSGNLRFVEKELPNLQQLAASVPDQGVTSLYAKAMEGVLLHYKGQWAGSLSVLEACLDEARQAGKVTHFDSIAMQLSDLLLELNHLEDVENILAELREKAKESPPQDVARRNILLSFLRIKQGQFDEARGLLNEVRGNSPDPHMMPLGKLNIRLAEARMAAAEGNWEKSLAGYAVIERAARIAKLRWYRAYFQIEWAQACIASGIAVELAHAARLLRQAMGLFEDINAPSYAAMAREILKANNLPATVNLYRAA